MSLLTYAEQSNFCQTGRSQEVDRLLAEFAKHWPSAVHAFEYGRSCEGRAMRAMLVSRSGVLSAAELKRQGVPLLMIQGGIHPGESDGKDGGFIALRELLEGAVGGDLLERLAILFVPAFNVDGHERFGRWNRPNQVGPEETGWRTTAQNINLNRDHMKAEAPEMQAMLRLLNEWDPLICADLHVTDGADFEPDVSIQVEPINQGAATLRPSGVRLRDELIAKLAAQGSLPLPFYPDLARTDDPASGFQLTVYSPRFSTGYFPQRNRFTMLVETHSWKPYAHRVRVMRNTVVGLAELVALHGREWLAQVHAADLEATQIGGTDVILDYASAWREPAQAGGAVTARDSPDADLIEFRGFAYTREPSAISGDLVTVYDPTTPQIWKVPYRHAVEPALVVAAPRAGYLIPPGFADLVGAKLALHGIVVQAIHGDRTAHEVEAFRASRVEFSSLPFEGRMRARLHGAWQRETQDLFAGTLFVSIAQAKSRLIMALLEPQAPDSLAAWGFFNACFEQKEHMEPYVAEQIAREMLAADPELQEEFTRKLAVDAAFAANPVARLEFFLRRHASWDVRYNLYPVLRVAAAPSLARES